ncbi:MAG TPA: tautomerase family protein [Candidatus Copromorpha excrementigallinarum]|uniref:Tautomerase family protein n=1 Tax=Candidatus Allocopromorpha excrementigallinarum TaxID=2840742 RepID=A0A9D1I0S7_9FIRM|nr:tautomerase family protein [Candidatus Copromorpha excrementigallinarum]
MPHIDITMYPGRDDETKKKLALNVQKFIVDELKVDKSAVTVSIEDVPKEKWDEHMESMTDKIRFI